MIAGLFFDRADPPAPPRFVGVYRRGELNRCPCCGRAQWFIGRSLAECAFCTAALRIAA